MAVAAALPNETSSAHQMGTCPSTHQTQTGRPSDSRCHRTAPTTQPSFNLGSSVAGSAPGRRAGCGELVVGQVLCSEVEGSVRPPSLSGPVGAVVTREPGRASQGAAVGSTMAGLVMVRSSGP